MLTTNGLNVPRGWGHPGEMPARVHLRLRFRIGGRTFTEETRKLRADYDDRDLKLAAIFALNRPAEQAKYVVIENVEEL